MAAHYQLEKCIGEGGYGNVELARDVIINAPVAIKFIAKHKNPASHQEMMVRETMLRNETNAMIRVFSNHVVKLYAYNKSIYYPKPDGTHMKSTMLVTEYCSGGNLFDNIYHAKRMHERLARTYFQQLVCGVEDCHRVGVIHRDIKAQNVMFDGNYNLKIIDFGFAHLKQHWAELIASRHVCGTRGYQAPEILSKKPSTGFGADIFSIGVLLFIMLAGYPPFEQALKTDKWYGSIFKGDYQRFWQKHRGCRVPKEAKMLISAMLAREPQWRITLQAIKTTPWYNGSTLSEQELKTTMDLRRGLCEEGRKTAPARKPKRKTAPARKPKSKNAPARKKGPFQPKIS